MTAKWKPSKTQCELMLQAAALIAGKGVGAIFLEAGLRGDNSETSMNELLLNDGETELYGFITWANFKKGVQVTEDGRAEVDFYIRPKRAGEDNLISNMSVQVLDGEIMYLTENSPRAINCYIEAAENAIKNRPPKPAK